MLISAVFEMVVVQPKATSAAHSFLLLRGEGEENRIRKLTG